MREQLFSVVVNCCLEELKDQVTLYCSVNQSIIINFDMLCLGAKKLVQDTNVYKYNL